ncbi:cytidylyltransferase domain-containing protein [Magnetospira sp. QH-2]|uniref:acylneuraminate cytidylyltransferase family protein n=1 Tax=Magnetospira sp. (strain QH-2) TaxID=1288970 RepID=UPI0003E80F3F|nr:acylneuraminate cytidylyltransferase family protein [Magnetospira sp. QH-2]CCQ75525.1 putative N-acylneuraminate cytidylyltransferase [Magnetospira sp. QH-2]
MKRLCSICARAGSKGVHNKNLRMLEGRPLIAHTLEQALQSELFDAVAVSSDSWLILKVAQIWGATQLVARPDDMAGDNADKLLSIRHCAEIVEGRFGHPFDTYVDLDATSPLRSVDDIRQAVEQFESSPCGNLISGTPARRSPYFNLVEPDEQGFVHLSKSPDQPFVRRQDVPACYDLNASIYIWNRETMFSADPRVIRDDTGLYVMPEERSVDIDTELDFRLVASLFQERKRKQ